MKCKTVNKVQISKKKKKHSACCLVSVLPLLKQRDVLVARGSFVFILLICDADFNKLYHDKIYDGQHHFLHVYLYEGHCDLICVFFFNSLMSSYPTDESPQIESLFHSAILWSFCVLQSSSEQENALILVVPQVWCIFKYLVSGVGHHCIRWVG